MMKSRSGSVIFVNDFQWADMLGLSSSISLVCLLSFLVTPSSFTALNPPRHCTLHVSLSLQSGPLSSSLYLRCPKPDLFRITDLARITRKFYQFMSRAVRASCILCLRTWSKYHILLSLLLLSECNLQILNSTSLCPFCAELVLPHCPPSLKQIIPINAGLISLLLLPLQFIPHACYFFRTHRLLCLSTVKANSSLSPQTQHNLIPAILFLPSSSLSLTCRPLCSFLYIRYIPASGPLHCCSLFLFVLLPHLQAFEYVTFRCLVRHSLTIFPKAQAFPVPSHNPNPSLTLSASFVLITVNTTHSFFMVLPPSPLLQLHCELHKARDVYIAFPAESPAPRHFVLFRKQTQSNPFQDLY